MDLKDTIHKKLVDFLQLNGINQDVVIEPPKDTTHGDLTTNIALKASKQLNKTPNEVAKKIIEALSNINGVEKIEIAGPGFLNFFLNKNISKSIVNTILENPNYGESKLLNEKWLIEHTSANPNKAMHLGHLRTNLTGSTIANLAKAVGVNVTMDYIDNNRGIAIAKLMWGYLKFANKDENKQIEDINYWFENQNEWKTPEDSNIAPDKFMDSLYVKGANDSKNSEVEAKVRKLVVDWESEDKVTWALWEKVLHYVYLGQNKTLNRLGSSFDHIWHEHEHYKEGKDIVETGLKSGVFKKLPDGAIITDLKKYKLPDTVVIKNDGTSLYITQDLALTKKKIDKFKPDKLFWVIGPEQSLAMQQVFAVSNQLGFGELNKFIHIAYGFISIKGQGKMSSRAGNVVFIDDLLDEARDNVFQKIKNENLSIEQKNEIAEKVGIAAVKYSILKVGRLTDTAFDFETSLSFEGDSGPYLLYTFARCASILRQFGSKVEKLNEFENILNTQEESAVLRSLNEFPNVIEEAALNYAPNLLCSYLFELAQTYNKFYNQNQILKAENKEMINSRVALTAVTAQVLKKGLSLLGINTVDVM
jgi:arginyl-tRNA synthetase